MKIKKVKWLAHPILGDLELDFTEAATGRPFDNILFAGDNGNGKTTILESLSTFLNIGSFEYFDFIEYEIGADTFRAIQNIPQRQGDIKDFFSVRHPDNSITPIRTNKQNNSAQIQNTGFDLRKFGCIFSKARADYKTAQIKGTTTKTLDSDKYDADEKDDFTSLKQLIVDVENQDNAEYTEGNKNRGTAPLSWAAYYPSSKIYRFKNAFDNFFDQLKYSKVVDQGQEKAILFDKSGTSVAIDSLSTGEKQIVFRGIYLLKNNQNLDGGTVMIDEPELSMHPKWQKKILQYYKQLFTDQAGTQKTQVFFATHSEYVLSEALSDKTNNLVIVLRKDQNVIRATRVDAPSVLPSITNAETNYLAFDIVSKDYHIELYGHLQNLRQLRYVKDCDSYILASADFDPAIHARNSLNPNGTTYGTLTTYIRNAIDHPSAASTLTEAELRTSIELLIKLC